MDQREWKHTRKIKKKDSKDTSTKTGVTLLNIRGVSEALSRVFYHHRVAMWMKLHLKLKRMLVHLKDKRTPQNLGVVYQVPYKDCKDICTGETERRYGVREKENKNVNTLEKKYSRSRKKDSLTELHPSAITDHVAKQSHTIDWEGVKLPARDTDLTARGVKEAVKIRKTGANAMNRDGGTTKYHRCTPSCW